MDAKSIIVTSSTSAPKTSTASTATVATNPPHKTLEQNQTMMIDLHGLSVERAQRRVTQYIKHAPSAGWNKIRFVTGRGNHVNARGERGTLYKSFKEWLQAVPGNIAKIEQFDGYYEVDIKDNIPIRNPFMAFLDKSVEQSLKENIDEIKKEAEKSNVDNMTALALCYDKGIGVKQSYQKATKLYLKLAEQKHALAQYEVGCRYFIGKGIKQNDPKAIEFLTLSANQNFMLAEFLLGNIYWKGYGIFPINYVLANQYFLKAANHGHAEAARKLGCAYAEKLGVAKVDYAEAIRWWEKAVEREDCVAAFNLSNFYREGKGVTKDQKKDFYYLCRSAEWGDPDGQNILGQTYYFGDGVVKQDKAEGLRWLHRAADNVCVEAQFFLFEHYRSLKEETKAKEYLISAAENDYLEAQLWIACTSQGEANKSPISESKKDVKSNSSSVVKKAEGLHEFSPDMQKNMLERLLNQPVSAVLQIKDDAIKSLVVGLLLSEDSTQKQIKKGVQILEKLADEKCSVVLDRLGAIYFSGNKAIKKDIIKAYHYWFRGAELEDTDCLCSLGYYWHYGAGGKIDLEKAITYFLKAAAKGSAHANKELAAFYSHDTLGVKKDLKQAARYFQCAMELDQPREREKKRKAFHATLNTFQDASMGLAMLCYEGADGVPKDEPKAIELFKQSAADGKAEAALFLADHYRRKDQLKEFSYYLHMAADLGHEKAKDMIKRMPPEVNNVFKQLCASVSNNDLTEYNSDSKEQMLVELQQLSNSFGEQLEWKISTENRAWAYISDDLRKKLIAVNELKSYVKKSTDGRCLVVINDIYQCKLDEIFRLFEKATAWKTYSTAAALTSFGSPAIHQNSLVGVDSKNIGDNKSDPASLPPVNPTVKKCRMCIIV